MLWRRSIAQALLLAAAGAAAFGAFRLLVDRKETGAGADIEIISRGEPVNLRDHLAPGKYTLFDYYADWCPPCRELSPALVNLAQHHPNLALRKIDIVDWSHPVAAQQGVADLPYLRLYGPDGRLIREGEETLADLQRLFGLEDSFSSP